MKYNISHNEIKERGERMTLKKLREKNGLSQSELGEKVGLKQATISQYENGTKKTQLNISKKLSDALGISLDDFFNATTFQNEI